MANRQTLLASIGTYHTTRHTKREADRIRAHTRQIRILVKLWIVFDLLFLTNRDIIASVQAHIHWQKCALAFYGWDEME